MHRGLAAAAALVAGGVAAFFLVFATLFTDGPGHPLHREYVVSYALILAAFGLLGWAAVRWSGWGLWGLAWPLAPAVLVLVLYQDAHLGLRATVALMVAAGAAAGAWLGWRGARTAALETT